MTWRFSARLVLSLFLCIVLTTVLLTSSRAPHHLKAGYIPCLVLRPRPWRTLRTLAAGSIRTSASPAGGGFFFVEKDKTLRPCINYRGLYDITVKNHYPLPLISSGIKPLQGVTMFSNTFRMPTTLFGYVRETSGRRPSTLPVDITSTWSCRLGLPMLPLFSRPW